MNSNLGIYIALAKYPLGKEKVYIEKLRGLFKSYKENVNKYLKCNQDSSDSEIDEYLKDLYEPGVFHMFSHFDIALISLIDNFKFSQRVFEPHFEENDNLRSVSYLIMSGEVISPKPIDEITWIKNRTNNFIKIVQLKLNNGILVGNGISLFNGSIKLIEGILKEYDYPYLYLNSFL